MAGVEGGRAEQAKQDSAGVAATHNFAIASLGPAAAPSTLASGWLWHQPRMPRRWALVSAAGWETRASDVVSELGILGRELRHRPRRPARRQTPPGRHDSGRLIDGYRCRRYVPEGPRANAVISARGQSRLFRYRTLGAEDGRCIKACNQGCARWEKLADEALRPDVADLTANTVPKRHASQESPPTHVARSARGKYVCSLRSHSGCRSLTRSPKLAD